jgi:hypothetical protein
MTQMLEGSTLILFLALAALAVLIALCTLLLAPYTLGRALLRLARRPRAAVRPPARLHPRVS